MIELIIRTKESPMSNTTKFNTSLTPRRSKRVMISIAGVLALGLSFTACNGGGTTAPPPGGPCDDRTGLCAMIDSGEVYFESCQGCHGADARGSVGGNPPLANSDFFLANKHLTVRILLQGYTEPITVNGMPFHGSMPPFDYFTNYQIASVLNYLRVSLNDSLVVSCDTTQFDNEGFPICQKTPRTIEDRYSDTVSVAYVAFVRDSLGIPEPAQ
jgi:hypothetical protein